MSDIGDQIERGSDGPEWANRIASMQIGVDAVFQARKEARLAALREVREWVSDMKIIGYSVDFRTARRMMLNHLDAMIAKEEGR